MKGDITVTNLNNAKRNKAVAFKNNVPFINCISKINGIKIDYAEDLDVVMPMYNLLEYTKNYRKTTGNLWNYNREQPINPLSTNSESFEYKTSITEILITLTTMMIITTQIKLVKKKLKLLFH